MSENTQHGSNVGPWLKYEVRAKRAKFFKNTFLNILKNITK